MTFAQGMKAVLANIIAKAKQSEAQEHLNDALIQFEGDIEKAFESVVRVFGE